MRYPETKMHAHWIPPEVTERAEGQWELFDAASCDKCVEVVVIDAVELAELRAKAEAQSVSVPELLAAIKELRREDCGAWLKAGSQYDDKRVSLMKKIDAVYKAASSSPEQAEKPATAGERHG